MRKIIPKNKADKKNRQKQIIIGMILMGVMLFSVLGYSFQGGETQQVEKVEYNGYEFIKENGFWFTKIGNFQFSFLYNPQEIKKINSSLNKLSKYNGEPLYFSSEDSQSEVEIYRNLFYQNLLVERIQRACFEECGEDLPIKTCEDNFIIIKESNLTKIVQEDNCVFIEGPKENLTKITDEFLFNILEIR